MVNELTLAREKRLRNSLLKKLELSRKKIVDEEKARKEWGRCLYCGQPNSGIYDFETGEGPFCSIEKCMDNYVFAAEKYLASD